MTPRHAEERTCNLSDGTPLFYRVWKPTAGDARRAIVLFHRGHEHSGRWQDFIERVNLPECWCFAWDARGHGRSPGERGYAESFGRLVADADEFVRHVSTEFDIPLEQMAVVAQSVGAVIAATWVHDFAPPIRALAIATPALRIKLYVPLAIPGLRLLHWLKPKSFIRSYVKPKLLTHDPQQQREYAADKLISPQIAVNILLGLHDTATRLIQDAGAIETPTLLQISGADWVVKISPQLSLYDRLSSIVKQVDAYPEFFHSTLWEFDRQQPIDAIREFVTAQFDQPAPKRSLLNADRQGYTHAEFARLTLQPSLLSPKRWWYGLQWLGLTTAGRLSEGVQVGWRTGFDSGESLDHVYRNTPAGKSFVGRWIDRAYLNTPGWRGIRQRKVHVQQLLDHAIGQLSGRGEAVRLLDIAAGPGRYVLDTIKNHPQVAVSAVLCDRDLGGLEAGRKLAREMGIETVEYRASDAFDADAISSITPRPNLAIVSGLYELFPANAPIQNSLRGLAQAVAPGGFLIYTNQPWHPQQEMIARVLPNRDGDPWVMRCRTQAEMDELVVTAGFKKISMLIDDAGIFSVSLAVRE